MFWKITGFAETLGMNDGKGTKAGVEIGNKEEVNYKRSKNCKKKAK